MKLQLLQNKLPNLPKLLKSLIHSIYMLGKIIISKLPKSYLSYLNRKNSFKVRLVSTGKYKVSTQMPINRGFGKIGKIFYFFLTLQVLFSIITLTIITGCQPIYQLSKQDRSDLKKYPHSFLSANNKKHILKARRIEITDSLRRVQELDISQENIEEINTDRE